MSILLLLLGTGIIGLLILLEQQIEQKLNSDIAEVDMIVGAQGSPLQLVLSAIYQLDAPTGNIPFEVYEQLQHNPYVAKAVPMAYGDSYKGYKVVGTNQAYLQLFHTTLATGTHFNNTYEVVIGAEVAKRTQLTIGSTFYTTHGTDAKGHTHDASPFKVVGILKPCGKSVDRLLLTPLSSVWDVHATQHDTHEHEADHHHEEDDTAHSQPPITAVAITFSSDMGLVMLPNYIQQWPAVQAVIPSLEISRLTHLLGIGMQTMQYIGYAIVVIAGLSIFVGLYLRMQQRKYELAIMRLMAASRWQLMATIMGEALLLSLIGSLLGLLFSRVILLAVHNYTVDNYQLSITIPHLHSSECWLIASSMFIAMVAAIIPAIQVYRIQVTKTLHHA